MSIEAVVAAELDRPVPAPVRSMAEALAARAPGNVAAVLFYGSAMRSGRLDEQLDLYVLVDSLAAWHGRRLLAAANWLLPPNIEFLEREDASGLIRAKVAILRLDQFAARVRSEGADSTIWARFAQPVALPYCRDDGARTRVVAAIAGAVRTAAGWAARLGPSAGDAPAYWRALFAATYGAELRVETAARADGIVDHASERYRALLPAAWAEIGVPFEHASDGTLVLARDPRAHRRALRVWRRRRRQGKLLNVARLAKAALTVRGGAQYIAWKIERHSGVRLEPTPWQERHPLLAGLAVLWRLKRRGVIR